MMSGCGTILIFWWSVTGLPANQAPQSYISEPQHTNPETQPLPLQISIV